MDTATEHSRIDLLRHLSARLDGGAERDIADILGFVRDLLGMEAAFVARIEGPRFILEHVSEVEPSVRPGDLFDLGRSMPALTRRASEVVVGDRIAHAGHWRHPCSEERPLARYVGIALRMEQSPFGTLDFCDSRPRAADVSAEEIELVRLAGRWIESAIQQRRLRAHVNDIIGAFASSNRNLRAERRAREAVLAALPDLLLVVDAEGRCHRAHSPASSHHVRPWNSNPLTDYLPEQVAERLGADVRLALANNTAHVREHAIPGGEQPTLFEARIVPIQAEEGPPTNAVVMLRDMNDREEARRLVEQRAKLEQTNARLQSANAELETFAYAASHDLKSPLRALSNLSSWIEEEITDLGRPDVERYLGMMRERVDYLVHLVDDLLTYSRAGNVGTDLRSVRLSDLVARIVQGLGVPDTFEVTVGGDVQALVTAEAPLERVLSNAIGNAVQHHDRDGGQIHVEGVADGRYVRFTIADDGPGIPEEYREQVFGVFRRLSRINQRSDSTGMGLALIRKTIDGVGGQTWIEANTPRGTRLVVTWPRDWERDAR